MKIGLLKHACVDAGQYGLNVSASDYVDEGVRFLRTADLGANRVAAHGVFLPGPIDYRFQVREGDLLLSRAGTIGQAYLARRSDEGSCFAGYLVRFRPRAGTDARFMYYTTQSQPFQDQVASAAVVSTIANFNADRYANVCIPLPALDTQRRIADFLDDQVARIDNIIAARRHQLVLVLDEVRARRDEAMLGATTPGVRAPARWKPFVSVPAEWNQTLLRSVPSIIQTGPFGSQLHSEEYVDDGWPVVNPASLKDSRIVPVPGMTVSDAVRDRLSRHVLRGGDVIFGRRGELGRAALVTGTEDGWLLGTGSLMVRITDQAVLLPGFLARLLETAALRFYFDSVSVGSTMANLNVPILAAMPILLPTVELQRGLVQAVNALEGEYLRTSDALRHGVELLKELKRSLITAAVTGEFDVSSADGSRVPA